MTELFQSPSSQASSASSGVQNADNSEISQEQNYVAGQQGQLRGAIAGLGANPYLAAAGSMSPASYAVNPANTANFSTAAPQATSVPQGGQRKIPASPTPSAGGVPAQSNPFMPSAQNPFARSAQPIQRAAPAQ